MWLPRKTFGMKWDSSASNSQVPNQGNCIRDLATSIVRRKAAFFGQLQRSSRYEFPRMIVTENCVILYYTGIFNEKYPLNNHEIFCSSLQHWYYVNIFANTVKYEKKIILFSQILVGCLRRRRGCQTHFNPVHSIWTV